MKHILRTTIMLASVFMTVCFATGMGLLNKRKGYFFSTKNVEFSGYFLGGALFLSLNFLPGLKKMFLSFLFFPYLLTLCYCFFLQFSSVQFNVLIKALMLCNVMEPGYLRDHLSQGESTHSTRPDRVRPFP